jgi:hypothetical protein
MAARSAPANLARAAGISAKSSKKIFPAFFPHWRSCFSMKVPMVTERPAIFCCEACRDAADDGMPPRAEAGISGHGEIDDLRQCGYKLRCRPPTAKSTKIKELRRCKIRLTRQHQLLRRVNVCPTTIVQRWSRRRESCGQSGCKMNWRIRRALCVLIERRLIYRFRHPRKMPQPIRPNGPGGVALWDRLAIDIAFEALAAVEEEQGQNSFDKIVATVKR